MYIQMDRWNVEVLASTDEPRQDRRPVATPTRLPRDSESLPLVLLPQIVSRSQKISVLTVWEARKKPTVMDAACDQLGAEGLRSPRGLRADEGQGTP
jgi:hypothetical protein